MISKQVRLIAYVCLLLFLAFGINSCYSTSRIVRTGPPGSGRYVDTRTRQPVDSRPSEFLGFVIVVSSVIGLGILLYNGKKQRAYMAQYNEICERAYIKARRQVSEYYEREGRCRYCGGSISGSSVKTCMICSKTQ